MPKPYGTKLPPPGVEGNATGEGGRNLAQATSSDLYTPSMRYVGLPLSRVLAWFLFTILGPLKVRGAYRVPRKGGVLILSNHIADVDPVVVQMACPRPIHFMSKSELFEMKFVGWLIRRFKAFPVKRGEPDKGAIKTAVSILRAGEVVCIYPEGELSETGQLLELKPGIALIVRMAQCPVICFGLQNTNKVMPYGSVIPRPAFRRLQCEWGEPHTFGKEAGVEEILGWAEGQLRELTGQETY